MQPNEISVEKSSNLHEEIAKFGHDYKAFKDQTFRTLPVPYELKLKAQDLIIQGAEWEQLARATGTKPTTIRIWLKAISLHEQLPLPGLPSKKKAIIPPKPHRLMLHDEKISHIRHAIEDFGREYREHFAINRGSIDRLPIGLKKKARELFEEGSGLEPLSEVTGRSIAVVKTWVSSGNPEKPMDLKQKKTEQADPLPTNAQDNNSQVTESVAPVENPSSEPSGAEKVASVLTEGDWVRVRLGDVVMEIAWEDLSKRMQKVEPPAPQLKVPEEMEILNDQALDYQKAVYEFEKSLIVNALKSHQFIGEAAASLKLSRSTFDAKRKKFEL